MVSCDALLSVNSFAAARALLAADVRSIAFKRARKRQLLWREGGRGERWRGERGCSEGEREREREGISEKGGREGGRVTRDILLSG